MAAGTPGSISVRAGWAGGASHTQWLSVEWTFRAYTCGRLRSCPVTFSILASLRSREASPTVRHEIPTDDALTTVRSGTSPLRPRSPMTLNRRRRLSAVPTGGCA
jgi:hypothetical protein